MELSSSAFVLLRDLIAQHAGVYFGDSKRDTLVDKLSDLVAAHGMSSFVDYYYFLRYDTESDANWSELMDHLAVPETYFWREVDQVHAVVTEVVPKHFARYPTRPLRIWSAACCTGEEPISIAIALAEAGHLGRLPIEIAASDGSAALIERAREGLYGERSFRTLPAALRERYFVQEGHRWRVDPALHARIDFTAANLVDEQAVLQLAAADVIFCRNVFIYFSDDTITRVVGLFERALPDHGLLCLGAAESLVRLETCFELAEVGGAFVYLKKPSG